MYNENPPAELLQQGDVFKNVPFVLIPPLPLRIAKPTEEEGIAKLETLEDLAAFRGDGIGESAVVDVFVKNVIIISQTCDVLHRETIAVCPIYSTNEYKSRLVTILGWTGEKVQKRIDDDISKGKSEYLFYLPAHGTLEASIADFQYINTVKKDFLKIENRIMSLSDRGRNILSYKLAAFFSRPAV